MRAAETRVVGEYIARQISAGDFKGADFLLNPILSSKTAFSMLDILGCRIGMESPERVNFYLDRISSQRTMGGWVVIASALKKQLSVDFHGAIQQCEKFTRLSDTWYGVDIFGERVPGPALVIDVNETLGIIRPWRDDDNRWIRRMLGVSVHNWAKAARGSNQFENDVELILDFLVPMFTERNYDAVKGIGWGLKTLGRYYPDILTGWLNFQKTRPHTAIMMRKAVTFLPAELKERVLR